jgi:aminoacyl tRNA synthase complex-interacting multifunctional protein 1
MTSTFLIATSSSLRPAVELILLQAKVPSERVNTSATSFGVQQGAASAGPINGVSVMLRELAAGRGEAEAGREFFAGAAGAENHALFSQWVTAAGQVAARALSADAVELLLGSSAGLATTFLAGTAEATAAHVLLYAAVAGDVAADARRLPLLAKWCSFASAAAVMAPLRTLGARPGAGEASGAAGAAASSAAPSGSAALQGAGSSSAQSKPNAEEIERRRVEKEKAKAEKAAASAAAAQPGAADAPAAKAAPAGKPTPSSEVASTQLDIRVGRITTIAKHPDAEKLFVESIDMGGGEVRTIVSGLVEHYTAEALNGSLCLVVGNMKPKPLKGVTSHGMVLCASTGAAAKGDTPAKLELVEPPAGTAPGTRVAFGGKLSAELPPIPSNTVIVELLAHLKTNDSGTVCWKDEAATAAGAAVTSTLTNAVVK